MHGLTRQLPEPEYVLCFCKSYWRHPVRFEDLGLIVKFGSNFSTTEAVSLWAIRKFFHDLVPVPKVYGWRVFEPEGQPREVFIYMQLM
jgi:hypothetical protein